MKKGIMALEGLEEVISNPEVEAPSVDEVPVDAAKGDELIDVNQGNDIDDLLENINDNSNVVTTLESIANILSQSKDGLTPNNAKPLNTAIEHLLRSIDQNPKVLPAMEAFGGTKTKLQATMESIERIKEVAKEIWKKIIEAIKIMIQKVKDFFIGTKAKATKYEVIIKKNEEEVNKSSIDEIEIKINSQFYLNGYKEPSSLDIYKEVKSLIDKTRNLDESIVKAIYTLIWKITEMNKGNFNRESVDEIFKEATVINDKYWNKVEQNNSNPNSKEVALSLGFNGLYIHHLWNDHNREKQYTLGKDNYQGDGDIILKCSKKTIQDINKILPILLPRNDDEVSRAFNKVNDYLEKSLEKLSRLPIVNSKSYDPDNFDNVDKLFVNQIRMEIAALMNLSFILITNNLKIIDVISKCNSGFFNLKSVNK